MILLVKGRPLGSERVNAPLTPQSFNSTLTVGYKKVPRSLEGFQQTDCKQSLSFPRVQEVQFREHAIR